MSRTLFNPHMGYNSMEKEMNRLFTRSLASMSNCDCENMYMPAIDVIEDNENIYFEAELPGMEKDNIKIQVKDDKQYGSVLTISGEKTAEDADEEISSKKQERLFGRFSRSYKLPEYADSDNVAAKYSNGELVLTINKIKPKAPEENDIQIN